MTKDVTDVCVFPDDAPADDAGPDYELAVMLLAAGHPQSVLRAKCRFETARQLQAFCRDEETRRAVAELATERAGRVGRRAMVCLEEILAAPQTDLRAHVLAIRTALEVSGDLKRDHAAPVKSVRELTVGELNELIAATRTELETRESRRRSDGRLLPVE